MNHRGEHPFSCPPRDETYGLKRALKEHVVLHTGEKPYVCDQTARRPSLHFHRLLHCSRRIYTQPMKVLQTVKAELKWKKCLLGHMVPLFNIIYQNLISFVFQKNNIGFSASTGHFQPILINLQNLVRASLIFHLRETQPERSVSDYCKKNKTKQ